MLILHQGHASFDDPAHSLVGAAEAFSQEGFIVYGWEMPPYPHNEGPIERFYAPLDGFIDDLNTDLPIYMVGLSGGGWTTTILTSLNPRINKGYSVAGDILGMEAWGNCFEQRNPPHPYETLYKLSGNRLVHVYNFYEGGMMSGALNLSYEYVTDYTADKHMLSPWAVEYIIADIRKSMG